jgi:hypothetical protein
VVSVPEGHEGLRVFRVQLQTPLVCVDCVVPFLEFALAVSKVKEDSLESLRLGGIVTQ